MEEYEDLAIARKQNKFWQPAKQETVHELSFHSACLRGGHTPTAQDIGTISQTSERSATSLAAEA